MDEIQKQLNTIALSVDTLSKEVAKMKREPPLPAHQHTGYDMDRVRYTDLDKPEQIIFHTITGTNAATAANYGVFFIANAACIVTAFKEVHQTAGSDAGTVTVDLEKLTGTTAPDSGTVLLSSALSLKATSNTVQSGVLTSTTTNLALAAGNRLALKDAGTLTAVDNVTILLKVQYI